MKGRLLILLAFGLAAAFKTHSQSSFLPANLGSSVNSEYAELNPVIAPDGKTLYFVRANHPKNHYGELDSQDIWVSYKNDDGTWTEAQPMPFPFNTARYNAVYSVMREGNSLLINGIFDKKMRWKKRGLSTIHRLGGDEWGTPQPMKIPGFSRLNKGHFGTVHMNADENVIIISLSRRHHSKNNDLYVSHKDAEKGKWTRPKRIKKPVNSGRTEKTPYLSKDGNTLFFSSERKEENKDEKSYDLYYCTRQDDSYRVWSKPEKLDTLNSNGWQAYYSLNGKGSWAYFTSTDSSFGSSDIFRVKVYEERPFVEVSGKVINKDRNKVVLPGEKDITILINGTAVDSVKLNPDSGTYKVLLPLGQTHNLQASAEHYSGLAEEINATGLREFTTLEKDLYIVPDPFAVIKGRILVKNSSKKIGSSDKPVITVNGEVADSLIINNDGTFQLFLEHGKAYVVHVNAEKFTRGEEKIDLRDIHEYSELEKDLFVSQTAAPKIKEATMTGIIRNSKTMQALDSTVAVEIHVNDFPSINVEIKDSVYTLKLPLGAEYAINASAEFYYPVLQKVNLKNEKAHVKILHDLYLNPLEVGSSVKLENIFFETGKATLKPESFTELDRVARLMSDHPSLKIEIAGHTDNVGNADFNKKLSEDRAESVTNYILSKGVSKDRIAAVGYGMDKPVASNDTPEGRSQNRRVEFTILEK